MLHRIHPHIKKLTIVAIIIGFFLYLFSMDVFSQQGIVYSLSVDGAISPENGDDFIRGIDEELNPYYYGSSNEDLQVR